MRILFLTPLLPHPATSGGLIKTLTLLDYLRKRHTIHLLCFRQSSLSLQQETYAATFSGRLDCLPLQRGRSPLNLLRSYAAGLPLSVFRNRSTEMAKLVALRLAAEEFDAVFVDHWLMAQYLPDAFDGLTILHQHNAEHLIWRRQAAREANPLLGLLLRLEARRVAAYERSILPRFQRIFAVTEPDRQALIALGAEADRIAVLPNLPDPQLLEAPPLDYAGSPPDVLYLGTLSWQPNIDGLRAFLHDGLLLMRAALPSSRLIVAGNDPPSWLRRLARKEPSLELVSPDGEPLYQRARAFLEPVRGGAGAKVKVLNALARGLPVVASVDGAQGLDAVDGEHLLIGRDPQYLVEALARIVNDEAVWRRLSDNGRDLIRRRYHPEVAYQPLDQILCATA